MTYTPKSEEQLAKEGLLPDGEYDYEVVGTDDKNSKAGNPMFTLKLHVFDVDGRACPLTDYIALGSNFGERKLRHAADASNILDKYESGNMVAKDFMGTTGKLKLKSQDGDADFPLPKNVVKDYVKRLRQGTSTPPASSPVEDDEIPF